MSTVGTFIVRLATAGLLVSIVTLILSIAILARSPSLHNSTSESLLRRGSILITNANIVTMDDTNPSGNTAVLIGANGKILKVGGNELHSAAERSAVDKHIDARGRTVMPGLIGAHQHDIRAGIDPGVTVRFCGELQRTTDGLLKCIADLALTLDDGVWITFIGGVRPEQFDRGYPTQAELDVAAPDNPVYIMQKFLAESTFAGPAVTNSVGRAFFESEPDLVLSPSPFGRTPRGFYPAFDTVDKHCRGQTAGVLFVGTPACVGCRSSCAGKHHGNIPCESSFTAYTMLRRQTSREEEVAGTMRQLAGMNALGMTGFTDYAGAGANWPTDYHAILRTRIALQERALDDNLPMKIRVVALRNGTLQNFQPHMDNSLPRIGGNTFRMDGLGEFICFPPIVSDACRASAVGAAVHPLQDWTIHLHADNAAQIAMAIDSYTAADDARRSAFGKGIADLQWTVDHLNPATQSDLQTLSALGVGAGLQATPYLYGTLPGVGDVCWPESERFQGPPIRTARDIGMPYSLSTDGSNAAPTNPWISSQYFVTGVNVRGDTTNAAESVPIMDVMRGWTTGAAWSSREQAHRGQIKEGFDAEVIMLNQNVFTVPSDQIRNTRSLLTIVDGRIVHSEL